MSNTRKATVSKPAVEPASEENVLDLDAIRARRLEASSAEVSFRYGGKDFTVGNPSELPFELAEQLGTGDVHGALRTVLGDAYDDFMELKPSISDVMELVKWIGSLSAGSLGN